MTRLIGPYIPGRVSKRQSQWATQREVGEGARGHQGPFLGPGRRGERPRGGGNLLYSVTDSNVNLIGNILTDTSRDWVLPTIWAPVIQPS